MHWEAPNAILLAQDVKQANHKQQLLISITADIKRCAVLSAWPIYTGGHPNAWGEGRGAAEGLQPPYIELKKKKKIVDRISKVLSDLRFTLNRPLKTAGDWYSADKL